jgi:hypothetical protein
MSAFGQGFGCRPSRLEFSHPFKLDIQHLHVIPAQITERRGRLVLQIRAAVPAAQSSVLDGVAGRTPARPAHPDRRRAVPDDAVSGSSICLVQRDYGVFEGDDCDAFVKDLPLDRVAADVLIAFEMNGSPLRPENGYPVRLGPISPIA